jgi:hypothetical protein
LSRFASARAPEDASPSKLSQRKETDEPSPARSSREDRDCLAASSCRIVYARTHALFAARHRVECTVVYCMRSWDGEWVGVGAGKVRAVYCL